MRAGAARQFRVDARREDGQAGEASGRQRNRFDLRLVEHVAVGGIDGVHQRHGLDLTTVFTAPTFNCTFSVAVRSL